MNTSALQPGSAPHGTALRAVLLAAALATLLSGCAVRQPDLFPITPLRTATLQNGFVERFYDLNADGRTDFCERLGPDGLIHTLIFDRDHDGAPEAEVPLRASKPEPRPTQPAAATTLRDPAIRSDGASAVSAAQPSAADATDSPVDWPQLLLIIDSVPCEIVHELWQRGRLRHFAPPSRVISPFPVMTDVALAEFFDVGPCPGAESEYFDGQRLRHGLEGYGAPRTAPWLACVDYALPASKHAFAYLNSQRWLRTELALVQDQLARPAAEGAPRRLTAYLVTGSAIGSRHGRNGHVEALTLIDRWTQMLMHQYEGRLRITLMSDHGHDLADSRWVSLPDVLRNLGYRPAESLSGPTDVVIPTFGQVSCAAIYTRSPAVVAHDVVSAEGVELACFREGDAVIVVARDGRARITRTADAYHYETTFGDPLRLLAQHDPRGPGRIDVPRDGIATTADDAYPDALHRVWRAFDGLLLHTPDVLVALAPGYHTGSEQMSRLIRMRAAHGNLTRAGSTGFVMSTAGSLPPVMRMSDVAAALRARGISVPRAVRNTEAIAR